MSTVGEGGLLRFAFVVLSALFKPRDERVFRVDQNTLCKSVQIHGAENSQLREDAKLLADV